VVAINYNIIIKLYMVNPLYDRRHALLLASPVLAAVPLAAALVGVSLIAASSLRARDVAVRDGLLARVGHELEARLRTEGPDGAAQALQEFGTANAALVRGVEISGPGGAVARWGETEGIPVQMPAMLGPGWRPAGGGFPGAGMDARRGPARAPFALQFFPARNAGGEGGLALTLVLGSAAGGAGLVVLSLAAARGLAERARRERLEAERERLDTVALTGAGLAHRVRNPLAAIKGTAQLMAERPGEQIVERSRRIVEASARIEGLVTQLLKFARPTKPEAESFDLVALAHEAVARAGGSVTTSGEAALRAFADRSHAADVLDELLANARAHDPAGTLEVAVGTSGGAVWAEVRDRGPGLSIEPARAFDPYVTSRPGGTGLGLPTVRALARANGGDVTLGVRPGGGTAARLSLPRERR
jgi:signal transduction histidine kinase